jgi:hypothetical protein
VLLRYAPRHVTFVPDVASKDETVDSTDERSLATGSATKQLLLDAPSVMGPPDAEEEGAAVVEVVGGVVVVVVEEVVVTLEPPPPPVPPLLEAPLPPEPPLLGATGPVDVGEAVGATVEAVVQRFTSPENWLLLDSDASVKATSVRTAFESLPVKAEAEASMLTIAKRTQDETTSVTILGTRCAVFA